MSALKSSKRFGPITTGHRQWKDKGHCSYAHGYVRYVEIEFDSFELDERGWVVDFGDLKWVKEWLENEWDHRLLLAHDDPLIEDFKAIEKKGGVDLNILPDWSGPSIEQSCYYVYKFVNDGIHVRSGGKAWVNKVRIYEHENNWAEYLRES